MSLEVSSSVSISRATSVFDGRMIAFETLDRGTSSVGLPEASNVSTESNSQGQHNK